MALTSLSLCSLPIFNAFTGYSVSKAEIDEYIIKILTYDRFFVCRNYSDSIIPTKISEFRDFLIKTDVKLLHEILRRKSEWVDKICYITMIQLYHIYALKAEGNETNITLFECHVSDIFRFFQDGDKTSSNISAYLHIYYKGLSPSKCLGTIQCFSRLHPAIELFIKLLYCDRLQKRHYKTYKELIISDMEYFLSLEEPIIIELLEWLGTFSYRSDIIESFMLIILHLLEYSVVSEKMPNRKLIINITNKIKSVSDHMNADFIGHDNGYSEMLVSVFDEFVTMSDSLDYRYSFVENLLENEKLYKSILQAINFYCQRLMKYQSNENSTEFLKGYAQYLAEVDRIDYETRQQCCVVLLTLLHYYDSSGERSKEEVILNALKNLLFSLCKYDNPPRSVGKMILPNICYSINFFQTFIHFQTSLKVNDKNEYEETEIEFAFAKLISVYGITKSVKKILSNLRGTKMTPETLNCVLNQLLSIVTLNFQKAKVKYALLVLDVNMDEEASKSILIDQLTLRLGKSLDLEEKYANDKNGVVYKCYCIVRHAVKNENVKDIDIEEYKIKFTFIRSLENEEKLEKQTSLTDKLVLLLLLLLASTSSGGHHKSAELKKYLSLKYEYEDAILYLLWCSGDVEINPGPTFQKLEKLPNSQKERNWLYDICSVLGKLSVGITDDKLACKLEIWTTKPEDFPGDFSNPRKKSTLHLHKFYNDLLNYCKDIKKVYIPDCYQREIDQFQSDRKLLYKLFISRQIVSEITQLVTNLSPYSGFKELQKSLREINIEIKFALVSKFSRAHLDRSEITRDLAVSLCRICKGLTPTKKSDGIWKKPPPGWNTEHEYYSPHNAGKRKEKMPDMTLVDNLLQHIQTHNITIPSEYKEIVMAWEDRNIGVLRKFYTIKVNTASIQHSLRYLQIEGLLNINIDNLKQVGLTLGPEWLESDSVRITPAKRKRHSVNNANQKISSLVSSDGVRQTPAKRKRHSVNNVNQNIFSPVSSSSIDDKQQQAQLISPSSLPKKVDRTGSSQGTIASGNGQQNSECSTDLEHPVSFKKKSTPPTTSSASLTQDSIQQLQGPNGQISVGTQSIQVTNTVNLKEIDFMYADKVENLNTDRLSSEGKTETDEYMKDKQSCELPDISEQEIFSIIDTFNLNNNSVGSKSNLKDTNTHNIDENGDIENMIDITVFDTCT